VVLVMVVVIAVLVVLVVNDDGNGRQGGGVVMGVASFVLKLCLENLLVESLDLKNTLINL